MRYGVCFIMALLVLGLPAAYGQESFSPPPGAGQPAPLDVCRESLREQIGAYRRLQEDTAMTARRQDAEVRQQVQDLLVTKAREIDALQNSYNQLKQEHEALKRQHQVPSN